MAKRLKSDNPILIPIPNWTEADELIRRIGNLYLQINEAQFDAKEAIDLAKATLSARVKPLQDAIELHCRSLEAFAVNNKVDFGKDRSMKLNFGSLGWRKSTVTITTKKTLELIKKLFSPMLQKACINIKETVDKNALAKLKEEQLASVEARLTEKDVFYVEPALPQAVDYETGKHNKR
jgi:phage host-nuclease inhibitor protein Gam